MVNLGDKVYVKGNIGEVANTDTIASLVEYYANNSEGISKFIRQWYAQEVVLNYFETNTERDTYFVTNPTFLVEGTLIFVNNLGAFKYTSAIWTVVSDKSVGTIVVADGISEIVNARNSGVYSKIFSSIDDRFENIEGLVKSVSGASAVTSSTTNGNIKVNNVEQKVYDDTAIVSSLANIPQQTYITEKAKTVDMNTALASRDAQIASLASGSPTPFATLALLQADITANTTLGKAKNYLNLADGYLYYWNGTAWTKGWLYQSTGIANGSITMAMTDSTIKNDLFPFDGRSTLLSVSSDILSPPAMRDGIIDLKLFGGNPTHDYYIDAFVRNYSGTPFWQINIHDNNTNTVVSSFYTTINPEGTGLVTLLANSVSGSGVTANITIDFSKFPSSCSWAFTYITSKLHKNIKSDSLAIANLSAIVANNLLNTKNTIENDIIAKNTALSFPFLKDFQLINSDSTHLYGVCALYRYSVSGANHFHQIDFKDFTTGIVIASFYALNYTEPTGMDTIVLSKVNSGTVTVTLQVNWSAINTGIFLGTLPIYLQSTMKDALINTKGYARWFNKNWYASGDSVTNFKKYQPIVQGLCGISTVVNDGVDGRATRDMAQNMTTLNLANIDILTVECPANDFGGSRIIGTMADAKTVQSFYGDVKRLIDTILTLKPTIRLGFILTTRIGTFTGGGAYPTYPNANSVGAYQKDYNNVVKVVCDYYGIPVLDLCSNGGINEYNWSAYTLDNLHPNDSGFALISPQIANWMNTL